MVLQRSMLDRRGQSAMDIHALFYIYIYRSAIRCAKFGVVVFKASMLDWRRGWGQSAMGICALCYICQVWCNGVQGIYALLTGGGVNLPWVYMHSTICETY